MLGRLVGSLLVIGSAWGEAVAQTIAMTPEQDKQLACITDRLVAEKADATIAQVYASGDKAGAKVDTAFIAMDNAMIACQDQHAWSDEQTNLAAEIGMLQVVLDNYSWMLSESPGVTDESFAQLSAVLSATPSDDQGILMDGAWRDDEALIKRVSDRLVAAGLPRDPDILAYAFLVMEAKLVVTHGTMDWIALKP